jgi:probable phosphoglycerate mutase
VSTRTRTHVCLVRHGEVEACHKGTFYGGAEVPLSEAGALASTRLAQELAREAAPQAVFSSSLSRTLALAEPLAAAAAVPLHVDDGFRELDRGGWTHKTHAEIEAEHPGAIAAYLDDPETGNAPDGEPESAFAARVWAALDRAVAAHPQGRILIVTHGHVIRVAMKRVLSWDVRTSLGQFVPYHARVELHLSADGSGELLRAPEGHEPLAFQAGIETRDSHGDAS